MTRSDRLRQAILQALKASGTYITGDLWFRLVFASEAALSDICHELHINTRTL
jgi:hypothetical protein